MGAIPSIQSVTSIQDIDSIQLFKISFTVYLFRIVT